MVNRLGIALCGLAPNNESMTRKLLILVHPGSACGSSNESIGRDVARACREEMAREIDAWEGDFLVLDGFLSDELAHYPMFGGAIDRAVARNAAAGHYAVRERGCDAEEPYTADTVRRLILEGKINPSMSVKLTGASYDPKDEEGCVNGVYDVLEAAGFRSLDVLDSAVPVLGEHDDDLWPSSDDDEDIDAVASPMP